MFIILQIYILAFFFHILPAFIFFDSVSLLANIFYKHLNLLCVESKAQLIKLDFSLNLQDELSNGVGFPWLLSL